MGSIPINSSIPFFKSFERCRMRDSTQAVIAAFWLIFWSVRIFVDRRWYLSTPNGMVFLALYILAVAMGAFVLLFILLKKRAPKMLYRMNKGRGRCPECYAKVGSLDFCPKCGRDLTRPQTHVCWYCGYEEKDLSVNSCPKCGREFKKE